MLIKSVQGLRDVAAEYLKERFPRASFLVHCAKTRGYLSALARAPSVRWVPPGHFYSPLPAPLEEENGDDWWPALGGLDLRLDGQLGALAEIAAQGATVGSWETVHDGIAVENAYIGRTDGAVLLAMLRWLEPKAVIEVGSGYSSRLMMRAATAGLGFSPSFVFIDPEPSRLEKLLTKDELARCSVIADRVQTVPRSLFETLGENDLLFIDSSHVAKHRSDVLYLFDKVLPSLAPGVVVHLHDIHWPFEYPEDMLKVGIAWNEAYFLRAFLQFNSAFRILLFPSQLLTEARVRWTEAFPGSTRDRPSSIFIQRCSAQGGSAKVSCFSGISDASRAASPQASRR